MNLIFFRLIEVSTKKRENYINARSALLQRFSVLFFGCHTNSDGLKGIACDSCKHWFHPNCDNSYFYINAPFHTFALTDV